jgi:Ca-activated chloride channel family protein
VSFSFAQPWVLLFLALPVALWFFTWRRQGRSIAVPFDHSARRQNAFLFALLGIAESLPGLVLAVAIAILAGPQRLSEPRTKRVLTNIEFCIDVSGSMTAKLGEGTRYDASMKAIDRFLELRKGDAFGLTFFGNSVLHWVPLTSDPSAIRCAAPFMRPEIAPPWMGGTEIGKALLACRQVLTERPEGDRMIVLVSDGQSWDLGNGADQEIAQKLRADGIAVYTIHVAEGEIPGEIVNIAQLTGGEAFQSDDPTGLEQVFHRIDAMQEVKLEKVASETLDDFEAWCIAGLSALGLALLCLLGLRYTPW